MENNDVAQAVNEACKIIGSQGKLAELLGITKGNISQWKKAGSVPSKHCPKIEKLTGIPCERLNPLMDWNYIRSSVRSDGQ